jgi:hypothetical protein
MILYFIYVQEIDTKLITNIYHALTADCKRLQSEFDCVRTEKSEGEISWKVIRTFCSHLSRQASFVYNNCK